MKRAATGLVVLGLAALMATWALAASTPATLVIGTKGTPISATAVNGFNVPYDMSVAEALGDVRSVAATSLRYPPGNAGDDHDLTLAGLTGFQSTLKLASAGQPPQATVETRVFATRPDAGNKPEDAAAAARAAQQLGLKVLYWEIGNEPDLYSKTRGDSSWTPERYCQAFRAQREAILAVDDGAKFAGPAVSNVEGESGAFLRAFVKGCGDIVDLLTWHEYPSRGDLSDEAALATASRVSGHLKAFRALLVDQNSNPLGARRRAELPLTELGVTEYGLSYMSNNPRHLSDMVAALWAAETTLRLAEGGARLSQYFALIGSGNHGLVDLAGIPRPALYAFQMLSSFRGEALVASSSDLGLWVHAAREGDSLNILVSNTQTTARTLSPAVPGYRLISASTFTAQTVADEARPAPLKLEGVLQLPPRSMSRLVYKKSLQK